LVIETAAVRQAFLIVAATDRFTVQGTTGRTEPRAADVPAIATGPGATLAVATLAEAAGGVVPIAAQLVRLTTDALAADFPGLTTLSAADRTMVVWTAQPDAGIGTDFVGRAAVVLPLLFVPDLWAIVAGILGAAVFADLIRALEAMLATVAATRRTGTGATAKIVRGIGTHGAVGTALPATAEAIGSTTGGDAIALAAPRTARTRRVDAAVVAVGGAVQAFCPVIKEADRKGPQGTVIIISRLLEGFLGTAIFDLCAPIHAVVAAGKGRPTERGEALGKRDTRWQLALRLIGDIAELIKQPRAHLGSCHGRVIDEAQCCRRRRL
jgi:hypothetical protein